MIVSPPQGLPCDHLDHVTLAPVRAPQGPFGRYFFGAFDKDGQFIPDFAHPWFGVDEMSKAPMARLQERAVYGGVAMHVVGHFILEGLSRLWFLQRHPELPIIWHWIDLPIRHPDDRGRQRELITLLGLGEHRHIFLRQPLLAERLLLPSPGFRSGAFLHPVQLAALGCVTGAEAAASKRVWLSRSGLPDQFGRAAGEDQVETLLSAQGWAIIHPEHESMLRSATIFHDADLVSGFVGSRVSYLTPPRGAQGAPPPCYPPGHFLR